ncbi:MAG: Cupin domain protein, partial [Verrucomicrobia bacterium]|nr:Cupin domain protein [Verrucomicrobiota bacterium]
DLQLRRVPPGAAICPYHSHATQWEMFFVVRGGGTVRVNGARHEIAPGDVFIHPPGIAHQTINTGTEDLEVYIITDNPPADICHYPDSDKWGIAPHRKYFRLVEVDYFDGEGENAPPAPPPPAAAPISHAAFKKINVADLPWQEWTSPKRKFRGFSKELSVALGAKHNTPLDAGGHPFDLEVQRLDPGECGCPFHSHAAQWEMFVVMRGRAIMRAGAERHELAVGDVALHPPHAAHQILNPGPGELEFLLIADNPPVDYWHYPDSQKWGLREPRMFFRPDPIDYFDGEE